LSLEFSYNKLTELPESLFECSTLTTLKMGGNQLKAIPDSIRKLINLEAIFFPSNKLPDVTSAIG
jgi:Leucine-rich repeat (LRR) protein